ncbi:MAG: metallophosphoesterase [Granulosicoccus sp.]
MQSTNLPSIAVIADAHLHDIYSDYDGANTIIDGEVLTLRSWTDTKRSSRVFNESRAALLACLNSIRDQGIRTVVLLGDYSDDGQIESIARVVHVLRDYEKNYGMSFFALPGNHDYFGPCGKHQSTRFAINATETRLVSSDPKTAETEKDSSVLTRKMYCPGAIDALETMSSFGFSKHPDYLHWETPFGLEDELSKRTYLAQSADGKNAYELTDGSYLVEPVTGLWLLMLDANVFEPRSGDWNITQKKAFIDSSDAGWNSVLRHKEFLLNWIQQVSLRAKKENKCLLTFSHYPAMDPFNDESGSYEKLFGVTEIKRRKPNAGVAKALLEAGVTLHFGGHMHVNASNQLQVKDRTFTNIAVPSPVAFPPAYGVIEPDAQQPAYHTVPMNSLQLDERLMQFYKEEEHATGAVAFSPALSTQSYGEFLYKRILSRVEHRYLKKGWPEDIAAELRKTNTLDLLYLLTAPVDSGSVSTLKSIEPSADGVSLNNIEALLAEHSLTVQAFSGQSMMDFVADWYCLRDAGEMALPYINPPTLERYRFLSTQFGDNTLPAATNHTSFFRIFLSLLNTAVGV